MEEGSQAGKIRKLRNWIVYLTAAMRYLRLQI